MIEINCALFKKLSGWTFKIYVYKGREEKPIEITQEGFDTRHEAFEALLKVIKEQGA